MTTTPTHDTTFVESAVETLAKEGLRVWVFGGWAEEMLGIADSRPHGDIDLLYLGPNFDEVDHVVRRKGWRSVKHLSHKRAFELSGITIDVFLVQRDQRGYYSTFFGQRHSWPDDVVSDPSRVAIASFRSVSGFPDAFGRLLERREGDQAGS